MIGVLATDTSTCNSPPLSAINSAKILAVDFASRGARGFEREVRYASRTFLFSFFCRDLVSRAVRRGSVGILRYHTYAISNLNPLQQVVTEWVVQLTQCRSESSVLGWTGVDPPNGFLLRLRFSCSLLTDEC